MSNDLKIRIRDIWKSFDGKKDILRGVNLTVEPEEMLLIRGRSGSGKTTLLSLLGCIDTPSKGSISLNGYDTGSLSQRELAKLRLHKIGIVFQSHNLIHDLTVFENILLPLKIAKSANDTNRVNTLLEAFDIGGLSSKFPSEISGGERQRVAIARALANNPSILLADEPTNSLDFFNSSLVMDAFLTANKEFGTTVIIASHDQFINDQIKKQYVLYDGSLYKVPNGNGRGPGADEVPPPPPEVASRIKNGLNGHCPPPPHDSSDSSHYGG